MLKSLILSIFFACFASVFGISLDELICRRRPHLCDPSSHEDSLPLTQRRIPPSRDLKGPTIPRQYLRDSDHIIPKRPTNFRTWADYGVTHDDGTGYGSGRGPGYGPGMGDVSIKTGVGVQYPLGGLAIRRDFDIGFGGSGRIGGQPFGWGNGFQGNGLASSLSGWPHPRPLSDGDIWPLG